MEAVSASMVAAQAVVERWLASSGAKAQWTAERPPSSVVEAKLELLALESWLRAALAGSTSAKVELGKRDLFLAQRLFFTRDHGRRAVSMRAFNFWWRFIQSKGGVISLLQGMGIYCVYSRDLIRKLSAMIDGRPCLELGAGDGTLSHQLGQEGVAIEAVDDQSWGDKIKYPAWIEKLDAGAALAKFAPKVVLCSWPPPGNSFEKKIFQTPSVELYVVIGSKHKFATGDWRAYEAQKAFDWSADESLALGALPPEAEHGVLVFQRKSP